MRYKKKYTQKEWDKFKVFLEKEVDGKKFYLDVQELMCKRYDIILTDWISSRQKKINFLKKFNMTNFDKGMKIFDKGMAEFSGMLDGMFEELGSGMGKGSADEKFLTGKSKNSDKLNIKKLTGGTSTKKKQSSKRNNAVDNSFIKLWSDKPKKKEQTVSIWRAKRTKPPHTSRKKKAKRKTSKGEDNLKRIWG